MYQSTTLKIAALLGAVLLVPSAGASAPVPHAHGAGTTGISFESARTGGFGFDLVHRPLIREEICHRHGGRRHCHIIERPARRHDFGPRFRDHRGHGFRGGHRGHRGHRRHHGHRRHDGGSSLRFFFRL